MTRTRLIFAGLLFVVVSGWEFLRPRVLHAADDAATQAWSGPAADKELRPFRLGLQATNPWNERARALSIRAAAGAAVLRVDAGTAAHTAGLLAGDLIVRFGEYEIENIEDLIAAAASVPRGSQQTVIFVRGERRWQTTFQVVDNNAASPLAWYVHPSGAYRVRVPPAWQVEPPPEAKFLTILYDVLDSAERLYRVEFRREGAPYTASAESALAETVRQEIAAHEGAQSAAVRFGAAPAAWIAWYEGEESRHAYYRFALAHGGKLYRIEVTGPATATIDALPLPLRQLFGTLQTSGPPEGTTPIADAGQRVVRAGDMQLQLPNDWQDGPKLREGEALWRIGDIADPEASLALLRNQSVEPLLSRLKEPRETTVKLLGREAVVYEAEAVGTARPAVLRVVVIPSESSVDELIWVCYSRVETWNKYSAEFDRILSTAAIVAEPVDVPPNDAPTEEKGANP